VGVMIRSFPPHPNLLPCLRRSGFAQAGPRGEGRPFIPPAELGGILAYFDKEKNWIPGQARNDKRYRTYVFLYKC